ncbi:glutamate receptor 2-like [Babylonia areolata]|uniref:glutamate receptor 2-like n=2 Tax=Babylonia areolata TaxID=304850 RepID=UPI003FD2EFFC
MAATVTWFRGALAVSLMVALASAAREVSVASVELTPYLMVHQKKNGIVEYDGFIKELMDEVGKLTGLTFTFNTDSQEFGSEVNGSWTGLMGQVVNKKVDVAAAPLTITSKRRHVVHFSVPFQNFGPVIVLKRPQSPQPTFQERFQHLFAPLTHSVWLMTLVAYFTTSVVLYVICHVNPYEWRHLYRDGQATLREGESFTCMNTFWFVLSSIMWQGYTRAPRSMGGRLVTSFWWLFVVLLLLTYTASLTNMLRAGPTPLEDQQYVRITGLEDLATQTDVDFGFMAGGSTESYLKNAQVPYLRRIWDNVQKKRTSTHHVEEGIARVRQAPDSAPFAFVMESAMAQYMLRQTPCNLYMVGDLSITGTYALAYLPTWPLADRVDRALLLLRENGVIKVLEDKWFAGHCQNNVLDPHSKYKIQVGPVYTVTLGSFSGVLVILLAGVVAGALVTVIEIVIFRKAEMTSSTSEDEAAQPMKGREAKGANKGDNITSPKPDTENVTDV